MCPAEGGSLYKKQITRDTGFIQRRCPNALLIQHGWCYCSAARYKVPHDQLSELERIVHLQYFPEPARFCCDSLTAPCQDVGIGLENICPFLLRRIFQSF